MTLNKGDKVMFKNEEYEIMDYHVGSSSYWVREEGDYHIFVWSQSFVTDEFKKGRMHISSYGNSRCWHDYQNKPSFRFVHKVCIKCGKVDSIVNMMEKKK